MTALPLGLRRIDALRTLTTEALAVLMPFKAQEVRDQGGVYYGQNVISKNLIIANRKERSNFLVPIETLFAAAFHTAVPRIVFVYIDVSIPLTHLSCGCRDQVNRRPS